MKKILIIGGTGSWGQELTRQILQRDSVEQIIIYSRGEHKQVEMSRKFNDLRLKFVVGDIRDKDKLLQASHDIDTLFHLAALKHVPVCENNPEETVKTNIIGTINALDVAFELEIETFILVSTDKAVDPINVYGVSKSMAEKLVVNANLKGLSTKFVCIRGGNVLGTNGSVIPLFKKQIETVNQVTITEKTMTRYLMKLGEAISLIFKAVEDSLGGEIFVMKMPSISVLQLANVMIQQLGNGNTKMQHIGKRPGEKMHEVLVSRYEAIRAYNQGNYYVILPNMEMKNLSLAYKEQSPLDKEYNSLDNIYISDNELVAILKEEGWLDNKSSKDLDDYSKKELLEYFKREKWQV